MMTWKQLHAQLGLFNDDVVVKWRHFNSESVFHKITVRIMKEFALGASGNAPVIIEHKSYIYHLASVSLEPKSVVLTWDLFEKLDRFLGDDDSENRYTGLDYIKDVVDNCDLSMTVGDLRLNLKRAVEYEEGGGPLVRLSQGL